MEVIVKVDDPVHVAGSQVDAGEAVHAAVDGVEIPPVRGWNGIRNKIPAHIRGLVNLGCVGEVVGVHGMGVTRDGKQLIPGGGKRQARKPGGAPAADLIRWVEIDQVKRTKQCIAVHADLVDRGEPGQVEDPLRLIKIALDEARRAVAQVFRRDLDRVQDV